MTVYKDRGSGGWHWDCRDPLCNQHDWTQGGHRTAVRAARSHLSRHARFGFR